MIRIAKAADLDGIVALEKVSYQTDQFGRRQFRYLLTKANASTLVEVGSDGAIQGMCMLAFMNGSRVCRLYNITVHPDLRGRGIGKALLAQAERLALSRKAFIIRLEVRHNNKVAIRFYERHGFLRGERKEDYYEHGEAAWIYRKTLTPSP